MASVAAFMAALMAKETAIVWPAVLFAIVLIVPFDKPNGEKTSHGETPALKAGCVLRSVRSFHFWE